MNAPPKKKNYAHIVKESKQHNREKGKDTERERETDGETEKKKREIGGSKSSALVRNYLLNNNSALKIMLKYTGKYTQKPTHTHTCTYT